MKRVTLVKLLVENQDEALESYTRRLGFEIAKDNRMGDYRWLLVRLPETQPYGTGVLLRDLYGNGIYLNQD